MLPGPPCLLFQQFICFLPFSPQYSGWSLLLGTVLPLPVTTEISRLNLRLVNFEWYFDVLQLIILYILILYFSFRTSSISFIHVPALLWSVSLVSSYSLCGVDTPLTTLYRSYHSTIDFSLLFLRCLLYPFGFKFFPFLKLKCNCLFSCLLDEVSFSSATLPRKQPVKKKQTRIGSVPGEF